MLKKIIIENIDTEVDNARIELYTRQWIMESFKNFTNIKITIE